jgi:hypothetical protein
MATAQSRDVANLKAYTKKLKVYLRKQQLWQKNIVNIVKRLKRKWPGGPGVTTPPTPPFKP